MTGPSDPSTAWDQVGSWMQNYGTFGMRMLDRNLKMWSEISNDLRDDKYTADSMARDFAKVMTTSMSTLDDAWRYATRPPAREQTARALPSAFLLFRALPDSSGHSLASPVYIDVPFEVTKGQVPEEVHIELTGAATDPTAGVDALKARIRVRKVDHSDQYVLLAVNDQQAAGDGVAAKGDFEELTPLIPGLYDGLVYLETPPVALASIRVVVVPRPVPLPEPKVVPDKGSEDDVPEATNRDSEASA